MSSISKNYIIMRRNTKYKIREEPDTFLYNYNVWRQLLIENNCEMLLYIPETYFGV